MTGISNNYTNLSSLYGMGTTSSAISPYATNQSTLLNSMLGQYGQNNASSLSANVQGYLSSLKSSGSSLKAALDPMLNLTTKNNNLYGQKAVTSSNTDALSLTSGTYTSSTGSNLLADTTVSIQNIATAQTNSGTAFDKAASTIGSGDLVITGPNGKSTPIFVSQTGIQSNQETQTTFAKRINDANLGLTASVEVDDKTKTSKLVIKSDKTGTDSKFSVSGTLADKLGVATATTAASNAAYTVKGEGYTSQTNEVELAKGIKATLKAATTNDVTFTEKDDSTNLINTVRSMVNGFNKMLETTKDSKDTSAVRLAGSLSQLSETYTKTLSAVGIGVDKDGYLTIDEKKMKAAGEDGSLERFATNDGNSYASYGFTAKLSQIANKANSDPQSYLSLDSKKELQQSSSSYAYSSAYSSSAAKQANLSVTLNKYYNMGMLFDSMF